MTEARIGGLDPARYARDAAAVTDRPVMPSRRPKGLSWRRAAAVESGAALDGAVRTEAAEVLDAYDGAVAALRGAMPRLAALRRPRLLGKVEEEQARVERAATLLAEARLALAGGDVGACGRGVRDAHRELTTMGGPLTVALGQELDQAAFPRQMREGLEANTGRRRAAQEAVEQARQSSERSGLLAATQQLRLMAEWLVLSADILSRQAPAPQRVVRPRAWDDGIRVIAPQELETFADVGGLDAAKAQLRRTIGMALERADETGRASVVHNGILFHGPPGTGKTLLARALAGEYGLRFVRFSPALIASSYQHEPAKKLRHVFALAAESAPCLLFLDEVDAIGGRREGGSADQRELVTQLLNSLEEYRGVPGLVIAAATNTVDHLDPALREGRFDSRIAMPLPDVEARGEILSVQLGRFGERVAWDRLHLDELARQTAGRSGAWLAALVAGAAERAVAAGGPLTEAELRAEIEGRSGQDRAQTVEDRVGWDDIVLPEAARRRVREILLVFEQPELGRSLGVEAPAGILLYGPPGTGKTTLAKALASEVKASFYEQSGADLLSKWVGESEQRVAQLFTRARANRPSIIFIDEIDSLLKRRSAESSSPWEERVVSQFLSELDGLRGGHGVLLVGATNRLDIIDEAVRERRLVPIEVPLPTLEGRRLLLEVLWRGVRRADDVDLGEIARQTAGMSGADLKALRNAAGMRALTRAATGSDPATAAVYRDDVEAVLADRAAIGDAAADSSTRSRGADR